MNPQLDTLLVHIGLGSVLAACGGVAAGILLVTLRLILTRRSRISGIAEIREFGLRRALTRAFFEEQQAEFDFPRPPGARGR